MKNPAKAEQRARMRQARLDDIKRFIETSIERKIEPQEIASFNKLSDQALHLLAAAIDRVAA